MRFPCVHAVATTPAQRLGVLFRSFSQPYQPSPKTLSGRPARCPFRGLLGVHSRYGLHTRAVTVYRDTLIEGFSHFVTSMTAPTASGWSDCRVGLAPTGKRRLFTAHGYSRHRAGAAKATRMTRNVTCRSQITALRKILSRLPCSGAVQSKDDGDCVNFHQNGQRCEPLERRSPFRSTAATAGSSADEYLRQPLYLNTQKAGHTRPAFRSHARRERMSGRSRYAAECRLNLRSKTIHSGDNSNGDPGGDKAYSMRHREAFGRT